LTEQEDRLGQREERQEAEVGELLQRQIHEATARQLALDGGELLGPVSQPAVFRNRSPL
jgi:hypothetical protein